MSKTGSVTNFPFPGRRRRPKEVTCDDCGMLGICKAAGLERPETGLLDRIVTRRVKVGADEHLINAGDDFQGIYAVKSGAFKTYALTPEGHEHVIDIHLPGELIGMEAMHGVPYRYSVIALDQGSVCHTHFKNLDLLGSNFGEFQQALLDAMSEKLEWNQWMASIRGTQRAEQAVASFLLGMSLRFAEHGMPGETFRLPVSRNEIASYLGLALETVSRVVSRLQSSNIIAVSGRNVHIEKMEELREISGIPAIDDELSESSAN